MFTSEYIGFLDRRQAGLSLIELILFIMVVSVGLAGILSVMNMATRSSADPMIRKQAIAIAESLLEEVQQQPFTYCDPDDANAQTATSAAIGPGGCASLAQGFGPTPGEARYGGNGASPYDNVGDYHGFTMIGIRDLSDTPIPGLGGYNAQITVTDGGLAGAGDSGRIDVRVWNDASDVDVTLTGYRLRYAPNTTP